MITKTIDENLISVIPEDSEDLLFLVLVNPMLLETIWEMQRYLQKEKTSWVQYT